MLDRRRRGRLQAGQQDVVWVCMAGSDLYGRRRGGCGAPGGSGGGARGRLEVGRAEVQRELALSRSDGACGAAEVLDAATDRWAQLQLQLVPSVLMVVLMLVRVLVRVRVPAGGVSGGGTRRSR